MKMKKLFFFCGFILATGFLAVIFTGWYPVAIVGGSPIFYRTWQEALRAATSFTNIERQSAGENPIDFNLPENAGFLREAKRGTLLFLIEDLIVRHAGEKLHKDFEFLSRKRAEDESGQGGGSLERAAKFVYGLPFDKFRELVLYPQARRDAARELLRENGLELEVWLRDAKKDASVRLMFVPYSWDGEAIQ